MKDVALRKQWDEKLKESGFKDIERGSKRQYLKTYSRINQTKDSIEATQSYFRLCDTFLHDWEGFDLRSKSIFKLHCDGKSVRQIGEILGIPKSTVGDILTGLFQEMKAHYGIK